MNISLPGLQLGDQERGDPTPFQEAQRGLLAAESFFWIPGFFQSLGPLTLRDLPAALAGGTSHIAGTGCPFTRHAGTKRLAASGAGVAGSLAAHGRAGGQDRLVLLLPRAQLGERLTHDSGAVFTNERTEFSAKLVSTETGCHSGFGLSRWAKSATPISASSCPRKLAYGKQHLRGTLGSEISGRFITAGELNQPARGKSEEKQKLFPCKGLLQATSQALFFFFWESC